MKHSERERDNFMSFMSGLWLAVSRKIQQLSYAERMYLLDTEKSGKI